MASRQLNLYINSLMVNHFHDTMTLGIMSLSVTTKNPVLNLMAPSITNLNAVCFILSIVLLRVVIIHFFPKNMEFIGKNLVSPRLWLPFMTLIYFEALC